MYLLLDGLRVRCGNVESEIARESQTSARRLDPTVSVITRSRGPLGEEREARGSVDRKIHPRSSAYSPVSGAAPMRWNFWTRISRKRAGAIQIQIEVSVLIRGHRCNPWSPGSF